MLDHFAVNKPPEGSWSTDASLLAAVRPLRGPAAHDRKGTPWQIN
ncbi:MAG TPA: hypothetical protein VIJ51_07455 [Solirubrobacteraceae bacterium]